MGSDDVTQTDETFVHRRHCKYFNLCEFLGRDTVRSIFSTVDLTTDSFSLDSFVVLINMLGDYSKISQWTHIFIPLLACDAMATDLS